MQDLALVSLLGAQHVKKNDQNFPRIFPSFLHRMNLQDYEKKIIQRV